MALDPVTALSDVAGKLIERLWPDPAQRAAAAMQLEQLKQSGELSVIAGQISVNVAEASSKSTFVSGWRPFVGWVCATGLGTQFIIAPFALWASTLAGHPIAFPPLDMGTLMTLLVGMLGLGGMRTVEKLNGVASK